MTNTSDFNSTARVDDTASDFNVMSYIVNQLIGQLATTTLVKVKAVSNSGGVAAVGTVDVIPMVLQVDGAGVAVQSDVPIYSLPYFRLQGGADAVILDPKVDDIGLAVFCSRDISVVKRTKKQSPPGSARQYDWADGIYIGGVLNGMPTQYVRFATDGISVLSPTKITLHAPTIALEGAVTGTSTAVFQDEVTAKGTHTVSAHKHAQGADSHGDTEAETDAPTG